MQESDFFQLPLDELRVEFSVQNPREKREYNQISERIANSFKDQWGAFFPQDTLGKLKNILDRILIIDSETFPILIANFSRSFQGNESEDIPAERSEEEFAKNVFMEAGADYYASSCIRSIGWSNIIGSRKSDRGISLYNKLLEKFGDDVHRVFFGKLGKERLAEIIAEIELDKIDYLGEPYVSEEAEAEEMLVEQYKKVAGVAFREAGLIILSKKDRWELSNKRLKMVLWVQNFFLGKRAKNEYHLQIDRKIIAHEIAHILQTKYLD